MSSTLPADTPAGTEPQRAGAGRKAIMVLGPHRSGTSVITRALLCASVDLGQHLLEPNADNPKGFFENSQIVGFNDRLLKHLGYCWDHIVPYDFNAAGVGSEWHDEAAALLQAQFSPTADIAIKDPRLCLLAPFWAAVLQAAGYEPKYVLVLRHPLEAAASQHTRYLKDPVFHHVGATIEEGVLLWANYTQAALGFLGGRDFVTTEYVDFVAQAEPALRKLYAALGVALPESAVREFVDGFLDEALQRHHATASEADPAFAAYLSAYQALQEPRTDVLETGHSLRAALLADPRLLQSLSRSYVQARYGNLESRLELIKMGNIIGYQEHLLARSQAQLGERDHLLVATKQQFIDERRDKEQLTLRLAVLEGRGRDGKGK